MQVGVLRSEDGKSDCGLPTLVHHGPNFPHKPRLGPAVARKLSRFRQNPCIFLVCPQIWSRLSEGIIIQASSQTQPKVLTLSPPQTEPKSQTPHKLKSTTLKQNLDIRPQPKNLRHISFCSQGCISCGILVSGIRARGVSSEHMENMEMFSYSPTQERSDSQRTVLWFLENLIFE